MVIFEVFFFCSFRCYFLCSIHTIYNIWTVSILTTVSTAHIFAYAWLYLLVLCIHWYIQINWIHFTHCEILLSLEKNVNIQILWKYCNKIALFLFSSLRSECSAWLFGSLFSFFFTIPVSRLACFCCQQPIKYKMSDVINFNFNLFRKTKKKWHVHYVIFRVYECKLGVVVGTLFARMFLEQCVLPTISGVGGLLSFVFIFILWSNHLSAFWFCVGWNISFSVEALEGICWVRIYLGRRNKVDFIRFSVNSLMF